MGHHAELGALLGHVTLGMLTLDGRVRSEDPAPCTDRELVILQHLVASHHGRQEFGAAVPPMTLEAEVLHFADNASAKTASTARSRSGSSSGRAYRGTSDWGANAGG